MFEFYRSNLPQTLRMFSLKTLEKEYALRTHVYGRLVIELICINYFLLIIQGFWKNIYIIKNQT